MAQQIINTGTAPNDGTGDTLKTSFTKANANFTELYSLPPGNAYVGSGTAPSSPNVGDLWYDLSTGVLSIYVSDGNSSQWVQVAPSGTITQTSTTTPQGRLTLQSQTPVMTTTQAAKTNLFYSPYNGNQIPIYNGTSWSTLSFSELTAVTTDTTKSPAAIGVSKVNDWYVWNDAGTLRLSHGLDWPSDTSRVGIAAPLRVDGIWVNSGAITNGPAAQRGTYVGTTRSNATSTLDWTYGGLAVGGTAGFFGVWNAYNRVGVATLVGDTTATWTWNRNFFQAANASNNMRVSMVCGLDESSVEATYYSNQYGATASGYAGVGRDSTTVSAGTSVGGGATNSGAPLVAVGVGSYVGLSGVGFHYFQALEKTQIDSSVVTFYGTSTGTQTGLTFKGTM
jgi:hypothetical protein